MLSMQPDEYLTINGNIVIHLHQINGGRARLGIDADRSVPILRGAVHERTGGERPPCLDKLSHARRTLNPQKSPREQAEEQVWAALEQLDRPGNEEEVTRLREQLKRLISTPAK